ncbi:MAG: DUF4340 domain-containing protein [Elusimicrobiota bacterium]
MTIEIKKILSSKIVWVISVLVVLAVYFFVVEQKLMPQWKHSAAVAKKIVPIDKDNIVKFEHIRSTVTIVCEKRDKQWFMVQPVSAKADNEEIDSVLSVVTGTDIEDKFKTDELPIADCGLENPRLTMKFTDNKGKTYVLGLGDYNPTNSFVYVKRGDIKEVMTVWKYVYDDADKAVFDFRDKTLLEFNINDVVKINCIKNKRGFVIDRDKNQQWWYLEPSGGKVKVSRNKVDDYLFQVKNMKATAFAVEGAKNDDFRKYGFNSTAGEINLWLGREVDPRRIVFATQKKIEEIYARAEGSDKIFSVNTENFSTTPDDPYGWVIRNVIEFGDDEVNYLEFNTPIKTILAERTTTWQVIGKERLDINISDLVNQLKGMIYTEIIEENPKDLHRYGLDTPEVKVVLYKDKSKKVKVDTIIFGKTPVGNKNYCLRESENMVYSLLENLWERVMSDAL